MLDPRAAAITGAVLFGALCLLIGLANMVWPDYGVAFLDVMDSIYFNLVAGGTFGSVAALAVLSAIDGAILGFVGAWLHNHLAARHGVRSDGA